MTKTLKDRDAFLQAHKNDNEYYGSRNNDGTYTDHETYKEYKTAHPEDFYPVVNGEIQGAKSLGYKPDPQGFYISDGIKAFLYFVAFVLVVIVLFLTS